MATWSAMILPLSWMNRLLRRSESLAIVRRYFNTVLKAQNNRMRIGFLTKCLENDLIPKFLMFRVPNNGCFESKTVHNFQRKRLKKEIGEALRERGAFDGKIKEVRLEVKRNVPETLWDSVMFHLRIRLKNNHCETHKRQANKIATLADRQEKPLSKIGNTIKIVDELEIPEVIKNYLALGPKHPVKDDFDELQFLADIDALLHDMKAAGEPNEKVDEVNAQTLWYCKQMKKQRPDPMLKKVNTYLKRNGIKAVPFDKG